MHIFFIMGKVSDGFTSGRSLEPWIIFRLLSNEFLLPFQEKSWIYDKASGYRSEKLHRVARLRSDGLFLLI